MSKTVKALKDASKALKDASLPITVSDPATKNVVEMIAKGKYDDAMTWIKNKKVEDETYVTLKGEFNAYPADGAHAFSKVLQMRYGWVKQEPIRSFFGETPPPMITVHTSHDSSVEVPFGLMSIPNIEGQFSLGYCNNGGMTKFLVGVKVKKKHLQKAKDLLEAVKEYLKDGSIYKGKPVRLEWKKEPATMWSGGEEGFDTPIFMPPSGLRKEDLILPAQTHEEVNAAIFSLIEKNATARLMGIPTKRLILAAGPYGTGKTLTAAVTAEICRQYGRSFFYLREVEHLAEAIYFAETYAPACVFAEDIDRVTNVDMVDEISNTIDGVDTKNLDVIFILTTNHVNRIPKKFLRSGRSDMIIKYAPPDAQAAAKLIMLYGGSTLEEDFTIEEALKLAGPLAAAEMIPASIREVVERAKLFALASDRYFITSSDIAMSSRGVLAQCDMLKEKRPPSLPEHLEEVGTLIRTKADRVVEVFESE